VAELAPVHNREAVGKTSRDEKGKNGRFADPSGDVGKGAVHGVSLEAKFLSQGRRPSKRRRADDTMKGGANLVFGRDFSF